MKVLMKMGKSFPLDTYPCWEIASNFNCDLENQLGFLVEEEKINLSFLVVEGNTIPWCERKVYSLLKR